MKRLKNTVDTSVIEFQLSSLSSYIKELKSAFEDTISNAGEEMQEKIKDIEDKISDALRNISDLTEQLEQLKAKSAELSEMKKAKEAEVKKMEADGADEEKLASAQDDLAQMTEELDKVSFELEAFNTEAEKANENFKDVRREGYNKLLSIVTTIDEFTQEKIAAIKENSDKAKKNMDSLEKEIQELSSMRAEMEKELDAIIKDYKSQVEEAKKENEEKSAANSKKLDAMKDDFEAKMAELKKSLEEADEEKAASIKEEIESSTKDYEAQSAEFEKFTQDEANKFKAEQEEAEKEHQSNIDKTESKIAEIVKSISALKDQGSTAEKESAVYDEEIEKFDKLCKDVITPAYKWIDEEYQNNLEDKKSLTDELKKVQADSEDATSELESKTDELKGVEDKLAKNEDEINQLKENLSVEESKMAGMEKEHEAENKDRTAKHEAEVAEIKKAMEGASEEEAEALSSKLDAIKAEHEKTMEANKAAHEEQMSMLKKGASDAENSIAELEESIKKEKENKSSLDEELKELNGKVLEFSDMQKNIEKSMTDVNDKEEAIMEAWKVISEAYDKKYPSEVPFAYEGYYPLYSTDYAADAASPDGSGHHTHVFERESAMKGHVDEVTYYMPNGLNMDGKLGEVTQWHGDYGKLKEPELPIGEAGAGNIIALHGGGGNGEKFRSTLMETLGTPAFIVAPDGGYGEDGMYTWLPVVDKDEEGGFEPTTNADVADKSVDVIMDAINSPTFINEELEEQEPITLLGYSDGAAMIIAFLGRAIQLGHDISRIQRVVFIKGYVEGERHQGLDFSDAFFVPFPDIEVLIIAGQNDEAFYESTLAAQTYFAIEPTLETTKGGHEMELGNAATWISKRVRPSNIPGEGEFDPVGELALVQMSNQEILNELAKISKLENHSWNGRQTGPPEAGTQQDEEKWNLFLKYFFGPDDAGVVEVIEAEGETQYRINISSDGEIQSIIIGSATGNGTTQLDFGHEEFEQFGLPHNRYGFYNFNGEFVAGFIIPGQKDEKTAALINRLVSSYKMAGFISTTTKFVELEGGEGEMLEKEVAEGEEEMAEPTEELGAAKIHKVWAKNSSDQYVETEGFKNYLNGIPAGTWYEIDQDFAGIRHRFAIQADMYDKYDTNWRNFLMIQRWNFTTESWDAFSGTEHWNIKNVTIDGVAAVEYNTKVLSGNAKYRFTLPPQAMA